MEEKPMRKFVLDPQKLPISFILDGKTYKGMPEGCVTEKDRCIKCCACVKMCPQQARSFDTPYAPLISGNFKKRKQNRIII